MEELSISPEELLKKHARTLGIPTSMTLELTTSCQLSCTHCYNFDRSTDTPTTSLTYQSIAEVLEQAAALGVFTLELTGGESTLHPEIDRVIALGKDLNFKVIVKTHGAISHRRVQGLIDAGVDEVNLSLYGDQKVHDAFTGVGGSWQKTHDTMVQLLSAGIKTVISLIIHSRNVADIFDLKDRLFSLGAGVTVGKILHPRHEGEDIDEELRPSPAQWRQFYRDLYQGDPADLVPLRQGKRPFRCGCAVSGFAVAANGDVYPCIGVPWTAGSIYESSLQEIWTHSAVFQEIRNLKKEDFKHCQGCSLKAYCERIAPSAFMASGSYTGHDPSQCVQAQAHADYDAEVSSSKQGGLGTP